MVIVRLPQGVDSNKKVMLYEYGVEETAWVAGYSVNTSIGPNTQSKQGTYLYMQTHGADNSPVDGQKTFVTDMAIDLAQIKTLYIEWEGTGGGTQTDNGRGQVFSISQPGNKFNSARMDTIKMETYFDQAHEFKVLDVSAITGYWHIKVSCFAYWGTRYQNTKIYRVWGMK